MIDLREVRSVTEFQRNIRDYVGRIKKKKTPLILTVNGRAELVVQDAASYQLMLERLERAESVAAIRRGVEQSARGQGIPLAKAELKLRKRHGFSS
ncbi:MAG: type II toxin-antitoxin system Phd/YefM family antitoxin [Candidatus Solibacter usitatus]|nr:type II toxin-antitoxin system Phd/YefM family antitoxin [Candidatus Solibacter usitatus]